MKFHDSRRRALNIRAPEIPPETAALERSQTKRILDQLEPDELTEPIAEQQDRILRPDDFVFLSGKGKCWLIRTADIWLLEACGGRTRIVMPGGTVVVRRTLLECERRLDNTTFFRATRDCVINLTHVKQTRLLDCSRVLFVLPNDKQIVVSGEQNAVFRKMRAL
ncbi:MAG TPA: LytTR family DNA-binding domain-containing protein [Terrimicrobiaceae bacterium]